MAAAQPLNVGSDGIESRPLSGDDELGRLGEDAGQLLARALLFSVHGVERCDTAGERGDQPLADVELLLGFDDLGRSVGRGRFGFEPVPRTPSLTRVVTLVEAG